MPCRLRAIFCAGALAILALPGLAPAQARQLNAPSIQPVTARELVEIGGLSGLSVSPDGAYAVVRLDRQDIASNRTRLAWWVVHLKDGRAIPLTDAGGPRWNVNGYLAVETPQWSPDGKWIYFRKLN